MNKTLKSITAMAVLSLAAGTAMADMAPAEVTMPGAMAVMAAPLADDDEGEPSIRYAYHREPTAGFLSGDAGDIENMAAFMIPQDVAKQYTGAYIKSVWVITGWNMNTTDRNNVTDVTVWVSENIFEHTFVIKKRGRLSRSSMTWSEVVFDTPYYITGESDVFVGATWIRPENKDMVMVTDRVQKGDGISFWCNYYVNGEHHDWEDMTDRYGSICMAATIAGNALPTNDVALSDFNAPRQVPYAKGVDASFLITNRGANKVSYVTLKSVVGSISSNPVSFKLDKTIGYNESTKVGFQIACGDYGNNLPVIIECTEVNGVPDSRPVDNRLEHHVVCMKEGSGFTRIMVEEEGTGTWCGNCPRGLLGMEYMEENYPDGFIGIGIHRNDAMEIWHNNSYYQHIATYTSYPNALFNRDAAFGNTLSDNYPAQLGNNYNSISSTDSPSKIEVEAYFADEEKTELNVVTTSEFVFTSDDSYRIAIVVTEDGVGPYTQENYYYGSEGFGQFSIDSKPSVIFNHVARYISSYKGDENSVPAHLEAGKKYRYSTRVPLYKSYVNEKKETVDRCILDRFNKFHVIALLINQESGIIENAAKVSCNQNLDVNGIGYVESMSTDATVNVVAGGIEIVGNYDTATICNINGTVVSAFTGNSYISLPAGLYIVVVDGKATKVIVR